MKKPSESVRKNLQFILTLIYSLAVFSIYVLAAAHGAGHLMRTGCIFILLLCAGIVIIHMAGRRKKTAGTDSPDRLVLSRTLFDAVDRMDSPALMCRSDGRVFWCNEATRSSMTDGRRPYGRTIGELLGVSLDDIRDAPSEDGLGVTFYDRYYIAKQCSIKLERGGALVILTESSELKTMGDELDLIHERLDECDPVVAYVYVDNLTEMIKYDNESYRPATAKIDEIMCEWAADVSGIIKEYERDRYMLVFEKKHLERYIERRFDILDRIREIRVGAEQLSVTVSVGIASVYGSFADKDRAARAALEMALGRGGDQVAVRNDETTEFYGGRTRASRNRSSVRSRVVSNELLMHISRSSNVLIMGHHFPDYDSIGACVGLARLAMFCGVKVNIIADRYDSNVSLCLPFLSGTEDFRHVFVSPDEGLDLMQTGTFVILADVNNVSIVEDPEIVSAAKQFAVIDHHRKTADYALEPELEYIDPKASSACELVSEMLEQVLPQDILKPGEASLMLAGIMLDTKQFTRMTGTRTYSAALYLHDSGAEAQAVQDLFKTELDDYILEARFRSNVEIYRGSMAITVCRSSDEGSEGEAADKITAAKAAEGLVGVRGIKAAFALVQLGETLHISARSTGDVNVQLILERLRGGGHFDIAGAQLTGVSIDEALAMLRSSIDEYLNDGAKD